MACAILRDRGIAARGLVDGIEGWKTGGYPTVKRIDAPHGWITRERPKVDRIACPWFIRRFVDPSAPILFVAADQVDLHVCPECTGQLVYPVGWEERRGDSWEITLRCPDCEWWHTGEYHDDEVERFDDALNDGTEDLLATLRTFARANMEDDVERLVEAIHCDLILPMDF